MYGEVSDQVIQCVLCKGEAPKEQQETYILPQFNVWLRKGNVTTTGKKVYPVFQKIICKSCDYRQKHVRG